MNRLYFMATSMAMFCMEKAGENGGGGGGATNPPAPTPPAPAPAANGSVTLSKEQFDELMGRVKNPPAPTPGSPPAKEDDDLASRARKEKEDKDRAAADTKTLQSAIRFNLTAKEWAKTNEALLPGTIQSIFDQADRESYDTESDKANAIKVSVVLEFFTQQANLDLLTDSQKNQLEEFKKLTKTDRQARVSGLYENVFEPTFEQLKRLKRAEQVNKGLGTSTDAETKFKEKMIAISRKAYLKKGSK